MSYEISVYSTNKQPISGEQLKSVLESMGWSITFVSGRRDQQSVVDSHGLLLDGANIYGWKTGEKDATLFNELMSAGKFGELWELPRAFMVISTCWITLSMSYDIREEWDEDEIAELDDFDEEYVRYLRAAEVHYGLRAGRSNGSIQFTCEVGRAIGHLIGGLFDNPHDGARELLAAH